MLCLQSKRGSNGEIYERLPLLPKYVVRVRQYGNNVALTIDDIDRRFDKVTWERNGEKIGHNNQKFHILLDLPNVVSLVIHDVTINDSATYQCILKSGSDMERSELTVLELCPIKLIGPTFQIKTELTRTQIQSRLTHQPYLSTNWRSRNYVKYDVIISTVKTTEHINKDPFYETSETAITRSLHYGILLSKNSRLRWKALKGPSVINDIYQRFHNTTIHTRSPQEFRKKCKAISTLKCSESHVTFASDDVEFATLWTFLQNGSITSKMEALFECRNLMILRRYFRSDRHILEENERCVCLPRVYREKLKSKAQEFKTCQNKSHLG
ncbi:uncharacterized protein LOC133180749 [Saccostrea echinata]|uniref:uncharacterized protein LOC133180749 n=1 Tax=Saccostrea echinata TaxID=191078 RepID=UPI002A8244C9|nr:uncharacterized protein LOC133180749 [Saccostrea echinata]